MQLPLHAFVLPPKNPRHDQSARVIARHATRDLRRTPVEDARQQIGRHYIEAAREINLRHIPNEALNGSPDTVAIEILFCDAHGVGIEIESCDPA